MLLTVNVYFAAVEPCTSAEGAVYTRYASHNVLEIWKAPFDPHLGLIYGVLAHVATRVAGVSELTIRTPALFGGILFWIALARLAREWLGGWKAVVAFAAIAANPWTFRAFSTARGSALALGFLAMAAWTARKNARRASLLVGLAVGSDAVTALPAIVAGAVAMLFLRTAVWKLIDEVVLPGFLTGLFFLLPALLVRESPFPAATGDHDTRELIHVLMRQPHGAGPILIGASRSIEPGVSFYRRRYHLNWMKVDGVDAKNEFYFLSPEDQAIAARMGLNVIQRGSGSLLAAK